MEMKNKGKVIAFFREMKEVLEMKECVPITLVTGYLVSEECGIIFLSNWKGSFFD